MEEQTIQQQTEIASQEAEYQEQTEPQESDYQEPENDTEPEISVDNEGEVNFSDDFFGDIKEQPDEQQPQQQAPNYYTYEELQNIPYEQWDYNRMPEEVKFYANALNEQTEKRRRQQQIQGRSVKPVYMSEPKKYTAKELFSEAREAAMQNLGLKDEDDIDEYDGEYQAAVKLAQDELLQKRNTELAEYQRRTNELQELQKFNNALASRPDYKEYERWYIDKCRQSGVTPEQVAAGLNEIVRRNGERYSEVQNYIASWYREFQNEKAQHREQRRPRRVTAPPVLEGTRGGYDGGKSINMRDFGELDSEAQAKALIDMGIV